jgi:hypothetical protein
MAAEYLHFFELKRWLESTRISMFYTEDMIDAACALDKVYTFFMSESPRQSADSGSFNH